MLALLGIGLGLVCYVAALLAAYSGRTAFEDEFRVPRWLTRTVAALLPIVPTLPTVASLVLGRDCSDGSCGVDAFGSIFFELFWLPLGCLMAFHLFRATRSG